MLVMGLACPGYSGANPRNLQKASDDTIMSDKKCRTTKTAITTTTTTTTKKDRYYDVDKEAGDAQEKRTNLWREAAAIARQKFADYVVVEEVPEFGCRKDTDGGAHRASHCERLQACLVAEGFQTRVQVVQLGYLGGAQSRVRYVLSHTGPHTTAFAWCAPFLKGFCRRLSPPRVPRFQNPPL